MDSLKKYGVKTTSGKVIWLHAENAEVREGMLVFTKREGDATRLVAGFALKEVHHFADPEHLTSQERDSST